MNRVSRRQRQSGIRDSKMYGGVLLCIKCGFVGFKKLHKLAQLCPPSPTDAGLRNITLYKQGRPPTGYAQQGWPFRKQQVTYQVSAVQEDVVSDLSCAVASLRAQLIDNEDGHDSGSDDDSDQVAVVALPMPPSVLLRPGVCPASDSD